MVSKEHRHFLGALSGEYFILRCNIKHQKGGGRSPPFYVNKLVVRTPQKNCPPFPVTTFLYEWPYDSISKLLSRVILNDEEDSLGKEDFQLYKWLCATVQ